MSDNLDLYRSLGRVEEGQKALLDEIKQLRTDFSHHAAADAKQFADINEERNKAKGAGWVILTLLAGLVSFLGAAVLAVLGGWLKF